MTDNFTELAFTESVKTLQEKYGTRTAYSRMERGGKFRNQLTWQEKKHIADRDGFYLSSLGENGWPYGNGQYISTGNFIDNNKTMLFLMDYPNKRRLKIWAEAEVLDAADHPELAQQLTAPDYEATVERIIVFKVHAFDWNCPQHITPRYSEEEIQNGMVKLDHESAGGA